MLMSLEYEFQYKSQLFFEFSIENAEIVESNRKK